MWTTAALLAALVLLTVWVTRVNTRHEERQKLAPRSPDQHVAAAWDAFGASDDPAQARVALDALLEHAPLDALASRTALVRVAVMALRAERHELLPELAAHVQSVGGSCGEGSALAVLAAAYTGDTERARSLFAGTRSALACSNCGSDASVKILLQEVAMVMDALADGAALGGPREPA